MTAVLRLKRPRGGATPTSFRLPSLGEEDYLVGRNGDECHVFLYVDEHPSFLSRVHAKFSCKMEPKLNGVGESNEVSRQVSIETQAASEEGAVYDNVLRRWVGTFNNGGSVVASDGGQEDRSSGQKDRSSELEQQSGKKTNKKHGKTTEHKEQGEETDLVSKEEQEEEEGEEMNVYWEVTDDKSVNGVFVNGEKLREYTSRRLEKGDRIFFGNPQHSFFLEYEFVVFAKGSKDALFYDRCARNSNRKKPQDPFAMVNLIKGFDLPKGGLRKWVQNTIQDTTFECDIALEKALCEGLGRLNLTVIPLETVLAMVKIAIFEKWESRADNSNEALAVLIGNKDEDEFLSSLRSTLALGWDKNSRSIKKNMPNNFSQQSQSSGSGSNNSSSNSSSSAAESELSPQQEASSVTSADDRTMVDDDDLTRLNEESDLDTQGITLKSRKRRNSIGQNQFQQVSQRRRTNNNSLTSCIIEVSHNVLNFFELSDLFRLREVCRNFKQINEQYLMTLTSLRWSPMWEQSQLEGMLSKVRNVVNIDASGCYNIQDAQVEMIAKITPNIETLDLSGCSKTSNDGIKALANHCKSLRSLRLRACKRIASVQATENLTLLAKNCPNLVHLDLRCCNMGDNALTGLLAECPNLKSLDIGSTGFAEVSDRVLFALAENKNSQLEQLGVMCCRNITDEGVAAVAKGCGKTLKHFTLHCCFELNDKSLGNLADHCTQLVSLNVHRCLRLSDEGVERLANGCGATLTSLDVSACNITDASLNAIAKNCPKLKILDVRSCDRITSAAIAKIAQNCPLLEQIDLSCCEKLDDDAIYALAEHSKNLTQVEFGKGFQVSERAYRALEKAVGLKASIYS